MQLATLFLGTKLAILGHQSYAQIWTKIRSILHAWENARATLHPNKENCKLKKPQLPFKVMRFWRKPYIIHFLTVQVTLSNNCDYQHSLDSLRSLNMCGFHMDISFRRIYILYGLNHDNSHKTTAPVSQRSEFESRSRLNVPGFPFVTAQVTLISALVVVQHTPLVWGLAEGK